MDLEFAFDAFGVDCFELLYCQTPHVLFCILLQLGRVDEDLLLFTSLHYQKISKNQNISRKDVTQTLFFPFFCLQMVCFVIWRYILRDGMNLFHMLISLCWEYYLIIHQQPKMFFGKILNQGQSFKFNPEDAGDSEGEVLSITNVVLAPSSKESVSLFVKRENEEFLIATLTKDRPHVVINLFLSLLDEAVLVTKGNGTLHLTGFYEVEEAPVPLGEEDLEGEEESEEEEVEVKKPAPAAAPAKVASPQQKPQSPPQKPAQTKPAQTKPAPAPAKKESEDEEDEDDVLEDDEDLDDDLDEEEEDEEEGDEDEEDEEEEAPKAKPQQGKPQQQQGGKPFNNQQGGKPFNNNQGGKPFNNNQGGKPHFNNNNQGGKPHYNNNQGGNKNWNNNNSQGGNKNWNNNKQGGKPFNKGGNGKPFNKGGKPFNKGGKPFHKN